MKESLKKKFSLMGGVALATFGLIFGLHFSVVVNYVGLAICILSLFAGLVIITLSFN